MSTSIAPSEGQLRLLSRWQSTALERFPYMASMLLSLQPRSAPGMTTFAVDAQHRLYVDFDAMAPKGIVFCSEALMHECGHLFGEHAQRADSIAARRGTVDGKIRNIAADFEINPGWRDAGCDELAGFGVFPVSAGMADYQTFEFYYAQLAARAAGHTPPPKGEPAPGSTAPDQYGPDGPIGDDRGAPGQGGPGGTPGPDENATYQGCGSGSGGNAAPCEASPDDPAVPGLSPIEQQVVMINTAAAIRGHEKTYGRGSVPAGMVERAEQILRPSKVPWRRTLASRIRRSVKIRAGHTDSTYSRPHRRRPFVAIGNSAGRIVMPGTFAPHPSLVIVRDTSGSMTDDDLTQVTVETVAIAKALSISGDDLLILDVDTRVHATRRFAGAKSMAEIAGRGGTDMAAGILAAAAMKPTVIIVITDGETDWPVEKLPVPVIAAIVGPRAAAYTDRTPDWIATVLAD